MLSHEGVLRGAHKDQVYDGTRLIDVSPSRLGIDGHDTSFWQQSRNFFSVTERSEKRASVLELVLAAGNRRGLFYSGHQFNAKTDNVCPTPEESPEHYVQNWVEGMPFGFPALTSNENALIKDWLDAGAPGPQKTKKSYTANQREMLDKWTLLLNGQSLKMRIVARYLYEHLYLAHLNFSKGDGTYFRLVRSRTAAPKPIAEIATTRPYDDPGIKKFFYRFKLIDEPIMHKSHVVFTLDKAEKDFVASQLLNGSWGKRPLVFPSYDRESASNPFKTFLDMPARGRYEFFLRNARYFTMTFIRGPVCEGQIAVNVIRDHFHVIFQDPDRDLAILDPNFLPTAMESLSVPAKGGSSPIESYYKTFDEKRNRYLAFRAEQYKKAQLAYDWNTVWDGEGSDIDAALTVFRHFDNSSVIHGIHGGPAKTVWMMDYPIFERMYYLLVAGFNVFGNVFHQASTRLYMDNLRRESEDNFLYLLPENQRLRLRNSWYQGEGANEEILENENFHSKSYQSRTRKHSKKFETLVPDYFKKLIAARLNPVVADSDNFHSGLLQQGSDPLANTLKPLLEVGLTTTQYWPEMTFMALTNNNNQITDLLFVSKLTDHKNVAFMFEEEKRLEPSGNRLIVSREWIGSYPNFLMKIKQSDLKSFVKSMRLAKSSVEVHSVLAKYGLSRDKKDFWQHYDTVEMFLEQTYPLEYGRLDLSKYANIYSF